MLVARPTRETVRKAVVALYERRILAGLCKYDPTKDPAQPLHAAPTKNIRRKDGLPTMCPSCYEAQLARKRRGPG